MDAKRLEIFTVMIILKGSKRILLENFSLENFHFSFAPKNGNLYLFFDFHCSFLGVKNPWGF